MKKNQRPLERITADIFKAERQNIFTIGKLLREAKAHFPHGKWIPYLKEIDWNERNAQLYMSVADLADKYETVSYLNAASTALYQLVWIAEEHPDALELAIERLKKSVERKDTAAQQKQVVLLSMQAKQCEDDGLKDITELALQAAHDAINQNCFGVPERFKAMEAQSAAIIKANPKTEEELKAVCDQHPIPFGNYANQDDIPVDAKGVIITEEEDEADEEEEFVEPEEETAAERTTRQELSSFEYACDELLELVSRPSSAFVDNDISADDLDILGNFLKQIAASKKAALKPTGDDDLTIPECLRRVAP